MNSQIVIDTGILKMIVETIVATSGVVYVFIIFLLLWLIIAVVDAVDAYKWRRKMPIILAAEMIKQTEEALDKTAFEYGSDYE